MKTIFALWFALCLSASAALPAPAWLASATKAAAGPSGPDAIFSDVFVDFESGNDNDLLTLTICTNITHQGSGVWSLTGVADGPRIRSIEKLLPTNAIALDVTYTDSGSTRCLIMTNGVDSQYASYTFGNATNVVVSFWWKQIFNGDNISINPCDISGGGSFLALGVVDNGTPQICCETDTGDGDFLNVSSDTWYWITLWCVQNATGYLKLYDANKNLLGTSSKAVGNNQATLFRIGRVDAHDTSHPATYFLIDDLVICYGTNYYYPLGPAPNTNAWTPTISAVTTNLIAPTSVSVTWTTANAYASSVVYYSTDTSYNLNTNAADGTAHTVTITNLEGGTTYNFKCVSTASGKSATNQSSFTTSAAETLWLSQTYEDDGPYANSASPGNWSQSVSNDTAGDLTISKVLCTFEITGTSPQYVTNTFYTAVNEGGSVLGSSVAVSCSGSAEVTFTWSANNPVIPSHTVAFMTFRTQYGESEAQFNVGDQTGGTRYDGTAWRAYRAATEIDTSKADLVFKIYTK